MAWLDWAVRFVCPSWEANVTTWNLGPLGYEYSRTQLQQLLKEGQSVVMVQEVRFPLGARQRVKNELKHLHPEYHCFLEAGKDPLPPDGEGMDTERPKSPWCNRGHFAVATFLHRGGFRSASTRSTLPLVICRKVFVSASTGNDYKFSTYIKQPQETCSSNSTHGKS